MAIEERIGDDGKRRYLVRIEGTDPVTGKRRRVRAGQFTNRREAERAEAAALAKRESGTLLSPDTTTLGVLLDEWLMAKADEISSNAHADYRGMIANHIKPALGDVRIQRLTAARLQGQYTRWRDAGLSPRMIRGLHMRISQALDYAVRMRLLPVNVARDARPPKLDRASFDHWTPAEAIAFLEAAEYDPLWPLWDLLLREGMRRGEALGLRWRDINWDRKTAHIVQTVIPDKSDRGKAIIQQRTKTRAGSRTVRLTPETIDALQAHRKAWLERQMAAPVWQATDLIICTGSGGPINPTNVTRAFNATVQAAGIRRIKVHELRHTCATLLLLGGVPAKVVSEKLGHASISLTLDTYSHVLPDMQDEAAAVMSRLLSGA